MSDRYYFWKDPTNGMPEFTSGGHGVSIIPGLGEWVLLHKCSQTIPKSAIPASAVVDFLDARSKTRGDTHDR